MSRGKQKKGICGKMWKTLWIVYKSPKKRFIFGDKVWIISGLKLASKFKKGYKY